MRHGPRVCREIVRAKIRKKAGRKTKEKKIDANKTQMLKGCKEKKEKETVWYQK